MLIDSRQTISESLKLSDWHTEQRNFNLHVEVNLYQSFYGRINQQRL